MTKKTKEELIKEVNEELDKELEEKTKNDDTAFGEPEEMLLLKERIETLENRIKIIQADNVNFRRRKEEEVQRLLKFANEDLILDIIDVLDNFDRALKTDNKELSNYLKGFQMIKDSLLDTLTKYGVIKIDSLGMQFDHHYHDAIAITKEKDKKDNEILEVFKEAYILKDKVIRHASVKVNKL